nr:hypothetical protein L204_04079 [Cryptococcus depauperatus CBS 7855]
MSLFLILSKTLSTSRLPSYKDIVIMNTSFLQFGDGENRQAGLFPMIPLGNYSDTNNTSFHDPFPGIDFCFQNQSQPSQPAQLFKTANSSPIPTFKEFADPRLLQSNSCSPNPTLMARAPNRLLPSKAEGACLGVSPGTVFDYDCMARNANITRTYTPESMDIPLVTPAQISDGRCSAHLTSPLNSIDPLPQASLLQSPRRLPATSTPFQYDFTEPNAPQNPLGSPIALAGVHTPFEDGDGYFSRHSTPIADSASEYGEISSSIRTRKEQSIAGPSGSPSNGNNRAESTFDEKKPQKSKPKRIMTEKRSAQNKIAQKKYRDKKKALAEDTRMFAVRLCKLIMAQPVASKNQARFKEVVRKFVTDVDSKDQAYAEAFVRETRLGKVEHIKGL